MQLIPSRRRWAVRGAAVLGAAALAAGTMVLSAPAAFAYTASCPAAGRISQGYHSGHDGIDIANSRGTPIYAVGAGTVTASGPAQGYGQWIRIRHDDGSMTEYGHMYHRDVAVNQRVSGGQRIALMGSEGDSTGPHLHLRTYNRAGDARGVNPVGYLSARGLSVPCTPGGNSSGNFTTWGTGVNIRQQPSTSAGVVTTLGGPTRVTVQCQRRAERVTADGYTNDAWSYLSSHRGWISNIYIDHPAAWLPGIPTC